MIEDELEIVEEKNETIENIFKNDSENGDFDLVKDEKVQIINKIFEEEEEKTPLKDKNDNPVTIH